MDSLQRAAPQDSFPEWTEATQLLQQARIAMDSILVYEQRFYASTMEERQLLRVSARQKVDIVSRAPKRILELLPRIEASSAPVDSLRRVFADFLKEQFGVYRRAFDFWADQISDLRSQRGVVAPEELADLELQIDEARSRLDGLLNGMFDTLSIAERLGFKAAEYWSDFDALLHERGQTLLGRLQIAVRQRNNLNRRVRDEESAGAPESEIGVIRIQLRYAERRVHGLAESLDNAVRLLDKRGVDTTDYRKSSIQATGDINEDLLDPRVLAGLLRDSTARLWKWLKSNLPSVLLRVLIVLAFVFVGRALFRFVWWLLCAWRVVRLPRLSRALFDGLIRPLGSVVGLISGLWFLGANPGTLLAGVGVVSVIIGLALQESLSNLASGFFILVTRPYDVDDVVMVGSVLGTVKEMGLANTTIRTFDGRRLMVPNRRIWGEVIENRSVETLRRVEITVRVGYDEDLDRALQLLRRIIEEDERALKKPEAEIFVLDLDPSWIVIAVRPWVQNRDWWPLLTQLPRLVRLRFAEEGIEIPYPRSDIALANASVEERSPAARTGTPDRSGQAPPQK